MCGIFGVIINDENNKNNKNNENNVYKLLLYGLVQLQNRGYDSAGLCVIQNNKFEINKYASTSNETAIDKLIKLDLVPDENTYVGIGHNRWATHGPKNDINAHPHLSNTGNFVIVHNGIIENYNELKNMLKENGYHFISQTDTEVIVNLIEFNYLKNSS